MIPDAYEQKMRSQNSNNTPHLGDLNHQAAQQLFPNPETKPREQEIHLPYDNF